MNVYVFESIVNKPLDDQEVQRGTIASHSGELTPEARCEIGTAFLELPQSSPQ